MTGLIGKAIEDVNALPMTHELHAQWHDDWQAELAKRDAQNLRDKIAVMKTTIRAAQKQLAEYKSKAREYFKLAWDKSSPYYKRNEMNLANVCFENVAGRLEGEIAEMEKTLGSLKRKLKKLGSKS